MEGNLSNCEITLLRHARLGGLECEGSRHALAIAQLQEMLPRFGLQPVSTPLTLHQLLMLVGSTWTNKQLLDHLMAGCPDRSVFEPRKLSLDDKGLPGHLPALAALRVALACSAASDPANKRTRAWLQQDREAKAAARASAAAAAAAAAAVSGQERGDSSVVCQDDSDACDTANSIDVWAGSDLVNWADDEGMNVLSYCIVGGDPEVRWLPSTFAVKLQQAWGAEGGTAEAEAGVIMTFGNHLCADGHSGGNIAQYKRVMCPWNKGNFHWLVLEVRPREGVALAYDPMATNTQQQRVRAQESSLTKQVLEPVMRWQREEQDLSCHTEEQQQQRLRQALTRRPSTQQSERYLRGPAPPGVAVHEWGAKACQVPSVLPQNDTFSCGPLALGNMMRIVTVGHALQPAGHYGLFQVHTMVMLLVKGVVAVGCMLSSQQE
jgi:hypothetical protein